MLELSPLSPSLVGGFGLTRRQGAFIIPSIYVGGLFFALPWAVFATLSALVTVATLLAGPAIDRLRMRSGA